MKTQSRIKLSLALIFTVISFLILVPPHANLGLTLFISLQIIIVSIFLPKSKKLLMLLPIFLISLSYTISDNPLWRQTNFLAILIFLSITILLIIDEFIYKDSLLGFVKRITFNIFKPLDNFVKPLIWSEEIIKEETKRKELKRILLGILISLPIAGITLIFLTSADMIFARTVEATLSKIFGLFSASIYYRIVYSFVIGFYLFGVIYLVLTHQKEVKTGAIKVPKKKDTLIFNIVLSVILIIYSIFIIIQFKYLFAGGKLPYGLSYAEYARRGFFELLMLSGLNIGLILLSCEFKVQRTAKVDKVNNSLLYTLCTVTIILLSSSFYRMYLYSSDFGLTRLRLYVFTFLAFELTGLLITYFYIRKPQFNILLVYTALCLSFYVLLNIMPADYLIAKNLMNKHQKEPDFNISYVMTLSLDAAPIVEKLLDTPEYGPAAQRYFENNLKNCEKDWRSYNLACERAEKLSEKLK